MCGGIFNNYFIANCPQNASVKKFENRLIFSEDMGNHKVGRFWDTVYCFDHNTALTCSAILYSDSVLFSA